MLCNRTESSGGSIVFVERKITALTLAALLQKASTPEWGVLAPNGLKARAFIGESGLSPTAFKVDVDVDVGCGRCKCR